MEELRQLQNRAKIVLIVTIPLTIIAGIALFIYKPEYVFFVIIIIIIPIIYCAVIGKKFKSIFKDVFVKDALKAIFSDLVFDPERGIDRNTIANTGMIYMGNRFSSNDYISGKYKDVSFVQSDVTIQDVETHTDSKGHTTTEVINILVGKWMIFDFNKTFKANVQVKSKFFSFSKLGKFGDSRYQTVKMEDEDFNKKFSIHAQNEHDAFYILTPQLMEKIKNLNEGLKGRIMLCFIDNKLHVALNNNKDSFEYSLFGKLDEAQINEYVSKEIKIITDFVDKLSLENDIFK